MLLVEARLGRAVEDVIREVYEKGGDQSEAALRLGVDRSTVSRWAKDLGIVRQPATEVA